MKKLIIRSEIEADYKAISQMHIDNFHHDLEANLICDLRKLPTYIPDLSQVLTLNGEVIGHTMLTPVKITNCKEEISAIIIGPVSIVKEYQGQGYGSYMVDAVLDTIKKLGYDIALVYGGDYYKRFGFEPAKYVFRPNPVFGHGILMKNIGYASEEPISGVIHYPHPFDPLINEWNR